jgi:hypothetical protein
MYSFAQRADTRVIDEPLYGHYLCSGGADHPGRDEVMASMNCDGNAVMAELLEQSPTERKTILFLKQMAHHLVNIDSGFLALTSNILLIRDPAEMLPSLTQQLPGANLFDSGLAMQWQLYRDLVASGQQPAIIDSRELLLDPAGVLQQLCTYLDIEFNTTMLSWPAGRRAEDGIWEKYWYQAVHQSTGFATYQAKENFPDALLKLLAECKPFYEQLFEYALRAQRR